MTDREDDFDRTAKDSEGRKVQQELERQLRELGNTMSDSFRHGFEGRGEEIGDRVWDVGRAAVNAAGYGISEAGRAFQAGKQEYQKRAGEAGSSASGMTDWARNFFAKKPEPTAIENIRTSAKKRHSAGVAMLATGITFAVLFGITAIACFGTAGAFTSGGVMVAADMTVLSAIGDFALGYRGDGVVLCRCDRCVRLADRGGRVPYEGRQDPGALRRYRRGLRLAQGPVPFHAGRPDA